MANTLDTLLNKYIDLTNMARKAQGYFPVLITSDAQYHEVNMGDIYMAKWEPITKSKLQSYWKAADTENYNEYAGRYNYRRVNISESVLFTDLDKLLEESYYVDQFTGYRNGNTCRMVSVTKDGHEFKLYAYEFTKLTKENFNSYIASGIYDMVRQDTHIESDAVTNKHVPFTFVSEEERDIYGAALLDGCIPIEAYLVMRGEFTEGFETFDNVNAYWLFNVDKYNDLLGAQRMRITHADGTVEETTVNAYRNRLKEV